MRLGLSVNLPMASGSPQKLADLLIRLAAAIGKARSGSDQDQFTVLDLLFALRKHSATPDLASFHERVKQGVDSMVQIVEAGQPYTSEQIEHLNGLLAELQKLSGSAIPTPAPSPPPTPLQPARAIPPQPEPSPDLPNEVPITLNLAEDTDILREYINESQEHLDAIEQGVLILEKTPDDAETLNTVFRAFHSFKGGAGFLNLVPINRVAHELESLLAAARKATLRINSEIIELILQGADILRRFVVEIQEQSAGRKPAAPFALPTEPLKAKVRSLIERAGSTASAGVVPQTAPSTPPSPVTPVAPPPAQLHTGVSQTPPAPAPEPSKSAMAAPPPPPAGTPKTPPPANRSAPATAENAAAGDPAKSQLASASVKVDTTKLDALVDLVGELVIAQSFVAQHPDLLAITNQFFTRSMSQLLRITRELQRTAMSMRMVPIGSTFQKMQRVVRDLAAKQQKYINLVLSGEETELDRTIVEDIAAPLMHMIRNAVDHGIEPPEARRTAGKPPHGTIHLRAFHQGGNIVIQIEDDGKGLSRERIHKKAVERGLIDPATEFSDLEIFRFIFAPGFSTAEVVTDISGRGVGMDVVKRSIDKLQGKIEIESKEGHGSIFTIYLPLTLAIIDALIVGVGTERFVIPTLSVRESFQLRPGMLSTVYNRGEVVKVHDRLVPLLRLGDYFGIPPKSSDPNDGIVVVLEVGRGIRCVLVDQLLHKQEVVIKNLGPTLMRNQALAGAAILGDGRVGLILDVNALVELKPVSVSLAA